jgi:hypothetical protein
MTIRILDELIAQAQRESWVIKYIAFSPESMKALVAEAISFAGIEFKVEVLTQFKDVPLKVKDITGFQVAYEIQPEVI